MPGATWRDMMMAGVFEFPSICLRALLQGYPLCGVQEGDGRRSGWYSGNFFWAHCGHVAAWPPMLPRNRFNAWWPEFVVFEAGRSDFENELWRRHVWGRQCAYVVFNCVRPDTRQRFDQSAESCPRSYYLDKIRAYYSTIGPVAEVPHKTGSVMNSNPAACQAIWKRGRYDLQPGYLNSSLYFF